MFELIYALVDPPWATRGSLLVPRSQNPLPLHVSINATTLRI